MHMHTRQGDAQTGGSPAGLLARPPDAKNDDRERHKKRHKSAQAAGKRILSPGSCD